MPRLRRFALLLAAPLALQQALAARAVVCVRATATTAAGEMAGMSMPKSQTPTPKHSEQSNHAPCSDLFGAGDCQPFAPCGANAALATDCHVTGGSATIASRANPGIVLHLTSRTIAPEPPPPRI